MAKTYYIQNTYTADIQIILKKADGRFDQSVVFPHYQMDRATGQIVSDGHLEISEELLGALKANGAFNLMVDKKKLVIKTNAPLKAGSFEQLLALKAKVEALEAENAELKEKLAKYEGTGSAGSDSAGSDDGLDKLKLEELKAKAKELGLDAESLTKKADVIKLIREADGKAGE